ncbi:hypothetical protein VNO77_15170 [Canavalia gladiata]|uniref:Uncharacterized protein n=1 Tax=Canavalia gladiata TaxID=3824 RepID=A0AAN9LZE3_CANGL
MFSTSLNPGYSLNHYLLSSECMTLTWCGRGDRLGVYLTPSPASLTVSGSTLDGGIVFLELLSPRKLNPPSSFQPPPILFFSPPSQKPENYLSFLSF